MSRETDTKLYHLHLAASTGQLPLNRSVMEPEGGDGLVWFEPAPGTRTGEYEKGFHPLLRDASSDLPGIELLELRHFRPDGVTIWQASEDGVRCCVIDEVGNCTDENGPVCHFPVHRIEKPVLVSELERFGGTRGLLPGTAWTLIEYWLKGRRIAWTLIKKEV